MSTVNKVLKNLKLKSFPSHKGPLGGADLRFNSPQPDTSRSCKSMDTGLMCHVGCLFKFPACTGTNLLLGEQSQCVNNLPKVEHEALRPGIEPATSRLQVRRPNHYATTPHWNKVRCVVIVMQGRKRQVSRNLFLLCWSATRTIGCPFHHMLFATGYELLAY